MNLNRFRSPNVMAALYLAACLGVLVLLCWLL